MSSGRPKGRFKRGRRRAGAPLNTRPRSPTSDERKQHGGGADAVEGVLGNKQGCPRVSKRPYANGGTSREHQKPLSRKIAENRSGGRSGRGLELAPCAPLEILRTVTKEPLSLAAGGPGLRVCGYGGRHKIRSRAEKRESFEEKKHTKRSNQFHHRRGHTRCDSRAC